MNDGNLGRPVRHGAREPHDALAGDDVRAAGHDVEEVDVEPEPTLLPRGGPPVLDVAHEQRRRPQTAARLGLAAVAVVAGLAAAAAASWAVVGPRQAPGPAVAPDVVRSPSASAALAGPAPDGSRPGLDAPGSDVEARPASLTGDLDLVERFVPSHPSAVVGFASAPLAAVPGLRLQAPTIVMLTATADGQAVPLRRTGTSWSLGSPGGPALRTITVRYRLTGALVQDGSTAGRALAVVTPLTAEQATAAGDPVVVRILDVTVRQAACLAAPPQEQLCGTAGSDGWVARLPVSSISPLVVFQVDLPARAGQ